VDVTDPAPEQIAPELFASLLEAMGDVDTGRLARDTIRLNAIGTPLTEVVRTGVTYGATRAEYGWNHSLATLADCLTMASAFEGPLSALPVIQGLATVSRTDVLRPPRLQPDPADVVREYGSAADGLTAFPGLIDDERGDEAEALLRGLLAGGASPGEIRHAFLTAITNHFLGYGHPMIYCQKAFELLMRIGWSEAEPDGLVLAEPGALVDGGLRNVLLDGMPEDAVAGVMGAVRAGVPVPRIIDVIASVAAARLGRFDIDSDTDDTQDAGWLDVTHTLTYVNALRWAWSAHPGPVVLRGVLHAAWFVQWAAKFDASERPAPVAPHPGSDANAVLAAIRKRDPDQAVALVKGYDGAAAPLRTALAQAAAEDNSTASIMVAHAVKTTTAAIDFIQGRAKGDTQA
jgi:hypothetical protein